MERELFEPEHDQFREMVRAYLCKEAVPNSEAWETAGMVDRTFWSSAAKQGLVGFAAAEAHGGSGQRDFRYNAVLDEEVVRTGTVGDGFSLTNDIVLPYFLDLADVDQQERWIPGIVDGSFAVAVAMSEPGTGSDLRAMTTTARRSGDGWRLTGAKTFITNGLQADLVIVCARIPDDHGGGFGLYVVEAGQDGFERGRKLEKIGRRGQDTAELFFNDVAVSSENVLGEAGKGLHYLMANLPQERLSMAVTAAASAEHALSIGLSYARERRAFGQPIGSFQANRFTLAELATKVKVARVYVDRCIRAHCEGRLSAADAAGAKFWTTELEFEALDICLQLHGGYGYIEEYEVARRWRDSRVQRIYGGTNEIMREIVGRSLGL